jgi:hypothetical protein
LSVAATNVGDDIPAMDASAVPWPICVFGEHVVTALKLIVQAGKSSPFSWNPRLKRTVIPVF